MEPYAPCFKIYVVRQDIEDRRGVSVFHYKHPGYDGYEVIECELRPLRIVKVEDV